MKSTLPLVDEDASRTIIPVPDGAYRLVLHIPILGDPLITLVDAEPNALMTTLLSDLLADPDYRLAKRTRFMRQPLTVLERRVTCRRRKSFGDFHHAEVTRWLPAGPEVMARGIPVAMP